MPDGCKYDSSIQRDIHAKYLKEGVKMEDLEEIRAKAKQNKIAVIVGCAERAEDRGSHSLYCSVVHITATGSIGSVHRKLMPTFHERLHWSIGDGNGLRVHPIKDFTVGSLNCYENWLPLVRSSLYAQGEDLHVAVWPGSKDLTQDITRFIAFENRSFCASVSAIIRKEDITEDLPHADKIRQYFAPCYDGGSCVAGPDGTWIVAPESGMEDKLIVARLDHTEVLKQRQIFDPSGHYSRPDVTCLQVNRERLATLKFRD